MTRGGWRNAPEYSHTESNANPQMRPSIDKLISKLRELSSLKGHPEAVEFVINDLAYWFFVREKKRPQFLYEVGSQSLWRFFNLAGGTDEDITGEDVEVPERHSVFGAPALPLSVSSASGGEAPDLTSETTILNVQKVIRKHRAQEYVNGRYRCRCEKFFSTAELWSLHVQRRIWKALGRSSGSTDL